MKYPLLLAVLFSCIGMAPARQTPPSPSDTVQRATAALQTDNASICTPHATGAETPPTLHPDTAQPSARTQFIRPPYLRPGDTVGIVTPARKLSEKADTAKVRERFESWGLKVKFGPHTADREQPYFAGTDAQRAADLQAMIDDPGVKAVVSFQGGYGSVRLLPLIDLGRLALGNLLIMGLVQPLVNHIHAGLGLRGALFLALCVVSVAGVGAASSGSLTEMTLWYALAGFGGGLFLSLSARILFVAVPPESRRLMMAIWS